MQIQPGKPRQNAYIKSYNRTVHQEWLGRTIFETIQQVQDPPPVGYGHTIMIDRIGGLVE